MKRRWAFLLSFVLGAVALGLEWRSGSLRLEAREMQTQDFLHDIVTPNVVANALLDHSEVLARSALPAAGTSSFCLFLSQRRKEPAWRWTVWPLLFLYLVFVLGPI